MSPLSLSSADVATALEPRLASLKLFKAKAAAELLSMTPQGFRKLAKKHGMYDLGGVEGKRWSVEDLEALKKLRRVEAPASVK